MAAEQQQYGQGPLKELANQVTVSTLAHVTDVRQKKPQYQPPLVKSAKYRLSVRSSVSKAQSGKIQQLGSFMDRAEAIVNQSNSNFYYQNNWSPQDFNQYQVQVQPRGRSQLLIKDSANNYSTMRPLANSGMSSGNLRGSKQSKDQVFSMQNLSQGQMRPGLPNRHRSAIQRKGQRSTLQKLMVSSAEMNPVIDYARGAQIENDSVLQPEDTRNLLERQAQMFGPGQRMTKSGRGKDGAEMRVICSSESQDERIKLVVVEHTFSDVIKAMYNNDQQRMSQSGPTSPNAVDQSQKIAEPDGQVQIATDPDLNDGDAPKPVSTKHRHTASDSTVNLPHQVLTSKHELNTSSFAEAQNSANEAASSGTINDQIQAPKDNNSKISVTDESEQKLEKGRSIKMMDTITFVDEFQPLQWIFTDLMGHIQSKEISQITINEVIKAFLINLNHNKKTDFNNDDLMLFLDKQQIGQKICFAIKGQKRELLDIKDLLDLRKKYPKGIDALQLFKIPTRSFLPFYFHHILAFDKMGRPVRSTLIRLPIKDVQSQMEPSALQAAMAQLKQRANFVQDRILQVSNDVVARLTEVSPVVLLNIVIVYLLEDEKFEPWFIGTEKCEVLTQRITHKRKSMSKNQLARIKDNQSVPVESSHDFKNLSDMQKAKLTTQNCKSQTIIDAPAQIRIIETDLQNLNSGGIKMNRGGRTPSTTTVFQKLDSRSQVTTQKNEMNDEDRYLMMLNGSEDRRIDENVYRDQQQRSTLALRRPNSQERTQELSQSGSKQSLARERKHSRPKTQIINNNVKYKNKPELSQQDISQQRTDGMSQVFGELGTPHELYQTNIEKIDNRSRAESSFSKPQNNGAHHLSNEDTESPHLLPQVEQQMSHHQSRTLSDKEAPLGPNFFVTSSQGHQQVAKDSRILLQSDLENSKVGNTANLGQGDPDKEALQQILNNNDMIENLREGVLFQAECPPQEENLIVPVVKEFKQRGKSAMIGQRRGYKKMTSHSSFQKPSDIGIKSTSYFSRGGQQHRNVQDQNVYLLQSNELLTENELFSGLARIGTEYGKEPKITTKARQLNASSRAKSSTVGKGSRSQAQMKTRMTNASRIAHFLDRQEQLKAVSHETRAQRLLPKAPDNRIMNLFPQFLDKSASRQHSKFLFGDSEQANVFRNYRNAMQSQETKVKNLVECMLPQEVIRNEMKLFGVTRQNQFGTKVFDFKTSDWDEKQFIEQIMNKADESHIANDSNQHSRPISPHTNQFGVQNPDLASLSMAQTLKQAESTITVGQQQTKAWNEEHVQSEEPDVTTSMRTKGRDFLAEALLESRKAFQKQSEAHTLVNQQDKGALSMIEAEKKLEGIVVSDPVRVLEDFHNTKLYKPALGPGNYNLVGEVPKVNDELATKYLEMKEQIRQQKLLQEAQQRMLDHRYSHTNSRSNFGVGKPRSSKNRNAGNQLHHHGFQPQQHMQGGRRVQQSAKTRGNPRIQLNMIEQNKQRGGAMYPDVAQNEFVSQRIGDQDEVLQDIMVMANVTEVDPAQAADVSIGDQQMIIDTQMRGSEHPASVDTIDQVNSMHHLSQQNYGGPLGFKCSMSLCCDNTKIVISEAMQTEDICYIQQSELSKARSYLIDEKRCEETVDRYLNQFQLVSATKKLNQTSPLLKYNPDLQTSPMPERVADADQNYLASEVILKQDESNSSAVLPASSDQQNQLTESFTVKSDDVVKRQPFGSRYQALTQRIILETVRSASSASLHQAGIHGIEVVRRVAKAVLDDCYGISNAKPQEKEKSPNVNSGMNAAAQSILKPIEDLSVKNPQIFKHEPRINKDLTPQQQISNRELNSMGRSTLEASKGGSSPDIQGNANKVPQPTTSEFSLAQKCQQNEVNKNELQPSDLRLSQLGIRHVKLEQENWVPSPELVPCCVRCFSMATYVLNYELGTGNSQIQQQQ